MTFPRFPTLLATLTLSLCQIVSGQEWTRNSSLAEELTRLNTKLTQAYESENVGLLREMLTEDHVHNNVFGMALGRDAFLNDIEKGVLKFEYYRTPEIQWHIDGDTAIATGIIEAAAIRDGKPVPANRFLFTRVYVKRDGSWKVLLFHNTMARIKEENE